MNHNNFNSGRPHQHYHYPPAQQVLANPLQTQPPPQRPFDSMDALLGELLREVLELRRDVAALRTEIAPPKPTPAFPATALRHGSPT